MANKGIKKAITSTVKSTAGALGNASKAVAVNRASDALVKAVVKTVAPSKVDSKIVAETAAAVIPIAIGQLAPLIFKSDKRAQKAQELCSVCLEHRWYKILDNLADGLGEPVKELMNVFKGDCGPDDEEDKESADEA